MIQSDWLDWSSTLGLFATAVLSFNLLLGILLSTAYRRSPLWKRMPAFVRAVSLDDLHNWTAYVALALALAHPLLLLADKSLRYRPVDLILPVSAPHQPVWTVMGSLALYAVVVVVITTQKAVKRWLGFRAWKNIHLISYGTALLFVVHGIFMDPELKDRPVDWLDGEKLLSEICAIVLVSATIIRWRHYRRSFLKKAGAISILAILFYTQLGYYGQFVIQQWSLKAEAREAWIGGLPDRCFFRVRLADVNADGHWEEEGKECWYKNHLYDVIRRRTESGAVWLYCMDDEREARLIRQSGEMTHTNYDHPDKKANHSLSPGTGDWLAGMVSFRVGRPLVIVMHQYGYRYPSLTVGYTEIVVPPPKLI
jgi:methionine sulfoxide reductase heme-binding subunit